MQRSVGRFCEPTLAKQFVKKRVRIKKGMNPFHIHINEDVVLVMDRIMALEGSRADVDALNKHVSSIRYDGNDVNLTWMKPVDNSYGKNRPLIHSRGLVLKITA